LYSALLEGVNHPCLYRALYIDQADYNPDFLSHLVVMAIKIRNAGHSDRGLLVHLSDILSGNIYGFGTQGHSAIYEELNTYYVSILWAISAIRSKNVVAMNTPFKAPSISKLNPYMLPWIVAKLTSDSQLPSELRFELTQLISLYDVWEPKTKDAKDLKFRLEGFKSKL
jgi:hypothetical protein